MSDTGKGTTPRDGKQGVGLGGAPLANRNALRHGLQAGKLPDKCQYIEHGLNSLRRQLEDSVLDARGSVSLSDAAYIQSILRWEKVAKLAGRWLRLEAENLTPDQVLRWSETEAKASTNRDKCIKTLNLDRDITADAWDAIDVPNKGGK